MGRRKADLSWIRTVLADPAPHRAVASAILVIDGRDERRVKLTPDAAATDPDTGADTDLDADLVEDTSAT